DVGAGCAVASAGRAKETALEAMADIDRAEKKRIATRCSAPSPRRIAEIIQSPRGNTRGDGAPPPARNAAQPPIARCADSSRGDSRALHPHIRTFAAARDGSETTVQPARHQVVRD